jgi:hypothetical protein
VVLAMIATQASPEIDRQAGDQDRASDDYRNPCPLVHLLFSQALNLVIRYRDFGFVFNQ